MTKGPKPAPRGTPKPVVETNGSEGEFTRYIGKVRVGRRIVWCCIHRHLTESEAMACAVPAARYRAKKAKAA